MAQRGSTAGIPIWVRVPGIIALVLVAVVVSAMLVGTLGVGGGSGPGRHGPSGGDTPATSVTDPADGDGGHRPPGGGH
ncbi:MAG: hypothetical protein GEV07_14450 [Streptosporangiales bacterium]|nr:hypothetical protein [Streptosporangiales bacterium]